MLNSEQRIALIDERLHAALNPDTLEIQDDSHMHAGHASAKGGGHFTVTIVADVFEGKSLIARHRLVYDALADAMQQEIHALSIKAKTPTEAS